MKKDNPDIWIPGSKSQTIRACLIAAFSRGVSTVTNPLVSSDTLSVKDALSRLGVKFTESGNSWTIDGRNLGKGLTSVTLDLGNSGTGTYLLTGLAASLGIPVTITGDESLCSRPVKPLLDAYEKLGCKVKSTDGGYPPFTITGPIKGGEVEMECRTSQYLSSLMLALPYAESETTVKCSLLWEKPYVTLTKEHLERNGITFSMTDDYMETRVKGNECFKALSYTVKGDWSSATFFMVLALTRRMSLTLNGLDRFDSQGDKRVLSILEEMGAQVEWHSETSFTITGPDEIKGGAFDINDIPDSLPALAVLGCFCRSDLKLHNAPQVRIKETDRISCMAKNLAILGVSTTELPDGIIIHPAKIIHGGRVRGYDDHRIIMALSVLNESISDKIEIDSTEKAGVTFPSFFTLLERCLERKTI